MLLEYKALLQPVTSDSVVCKILNIIIHAWENWFSLRNNDPDGYVRGIQVLWPASIALLLAMSELETPVIIKILNWSIQARHGNFIWLCCAVHCIVLYLFISIAQWFSTFMVLQPFDDISKVAATPNNRIDWVTAKESIFSGLFPFTIFLLA